MSKSLKYAIEHDSSSSNAMKPSSKSQSERFVETARELGVDEDEKAFEAKLKKIAKNKPSKKRVTTKRTSLRAPKREY